MHPVEVGTYCPTLGHIVIANLGVEKLFGLGCRVVVIVGEVVALGFTIAHGKRCEGVMSILMEADAHFWIDEVVLLVDVETLVDISVIGGDELVIDAIGGVGDVTILYVGKDVPLVGEMIGSLGEDVAVKLVGIAVVILVIAVIQVLVAHLVIGNVRDVTEMVRPEVLE